MKEKLIILYGGRSAEREVSVMSAENAISSAKEKFDVKAYFISKSGEFYSVADNSKLMTNESIDPAAKIAPSDIYEEGAVVFPVLHGPMGEDGSIQGFLEIMKMPYIGPNILAASVTMDKLLAKHVFEAVDIPQVPYLAAFSTDDYKEISDKVIEKLKFPVFVKPANMGSSVGISKVKDTSDLAAALDEAFRYDNRLVIEEGITNLREVECGMLGNEVSQPGEVLQEADFYDYKSKYIDAKIINQVPANISEETAKEIQGYAKKAYAAVNGSGMSRCDFFIDEADGKLYLNEINTIPGSTAFSMYPSLWKNMGLEYSQVLEKLAELAKSAFELRESQLV